MFIPTNVCIFTSFSLIIISVPPDLSSGCSRDGLTNNSHVRVNPDMANYDVGQRVTHSCDDSTLSRSGPRTRTCLATGEWDPPLSNDTSCPG